MANESLFLTASVIITYSLYAFYILRNTNGVYRAPIGNWVDWVTHDFNCSESFSNFFFSDIYARHFKSELDVGVITRSVWAELTFVISSLISIFERKR